MLTHERLIELQLIWCEAIRAVIFICIQLIQEVKADNAVLNLMISVNLNNVRI
jgi:hypothetical protein